MNASLEPIVLGSCPTCGGPVQFLPHDVVRAVPPSIDEDLDGPAAEVVCGAVARRNSVDGQLYACGFPEADAVHVSIEECSDLRGSPCDRPADHHEFVAPVPS
jgi:hypothetical protein